VNLQMTGLLTAAFTWQSLVNHGRKYKVKIRWTPRNLNSNRVAVMSLLPVNRNP